MNICRHHIGPFKAGGLLAAILTACLSASRSVKSANANDHCSGELTFVLAAAVDRIEHKGDDTAKPSGKIELG
jgi:hypothetical protein